MKRSVINSTIFVREFIKNAKQIGSVAPSGKSLASKLLRDIDFESARLIVEFGPGTGAITRAIVERLHPECRLISIEANAQFMSKLNELYPAENVDFIEGYAQDIVKILKNQNIDTPVDAFISSLPLTLISAEHITEIMKGMLELLKPNGSYVQYQYSTQGMKAIKNHWHISSTSIALMNIPPSIVYRCERK